MITVPEATEKIIKRSRYLSEAISKDLINTSSLARYIKPEIEQMLIKKVSTSAIIMSLKRLKGSIENPTSFQNLFTKTPEITVRMGSNSSASITIYLEKEHRETPGVYYFFLKSLAWERINILSINSENNSFTIVVDNQDVNRAFSILQSLFAFQA